jgi:UDP-N-acetylmuramoylalanine--D-glutamate ligase
MIEPDHLDVHAGMDDYISAKANIRRFQKEGDVCYYHPTNQFSCQIAEANTIARSKKYNDPTDEDSVYVDDGWFVTGGEDCYIQILPIEALQLPGGHNLENACAAIMACREFTWDRTEIEQGLRSFKGLDHRLKLVGKVNGVTFYDDSIATTPGSAIAALKAFGKPKVIILGGSDKGADYRELIEVCRETSAQVVAVGQTGGRIAQLCRDNNVRVHEAGTAPMDEVIQIALKNADTGGVVILSPASASFDMYKNYSERGNAFIEAVGRLGRAS